MKRPQSAISHQPSAVSHPTSNIQKGSRALTFVELLLAVAAFAILLTGLSSHLRGGVVVWRRVTSSAETLQRVRVTIGRLTQDLANAIVFDPSTTWQPPPAFSSTGLSCYTVETAWSEPAPLSPVVFVAYAVEDHVLTRTVKTVQEAATGQEGRTERLLDGAKTFSLQYGVWPQTGDQLEWKETWKDAAKLPKAVRLTMTVTGSSVTTIDRVILSPTGSAVSSP